MMKRLIYRLIVGLITFIVGLCLSFIWNTSYDKLEFASQISPTQIQDLEPIVTVCEITSHPELYLGTRIRLRGLMHPKNQQTLVKISTGCSSKLSEITIKLRQGEKVGYSSDGYNCSSYFDVIGYLEPKVEKDNSQNHYHITDAHLVYTRLGEYCF